MTKSNRIFFYQVYLYGALGCIDPYYEPPLCPTFAPKEMFAWTFLLAVIWFADVTKEITLGGSSPDEVSKRRCHSGLWTSTLVWADWIQLPTCHPNLGRVLLTPSPSSRKGPGCTARLRRAFPLLALPCSPAMKTWESAVQSAASTKSLDATRGLLTATVQDGGGRGQIPLYVAEHLDWPLIRIKNWKHWEKKIHVGMCNHTVCLERKTVCRSV